MALSNLKAFISLTIFCFAFSSYAKDKIETELTIYTEEFPPYNFVLEGRLTGINIEVLRATCKRAKITCKFEIYPWNRSMRYASSRADSGLVSTARIPSREHLFQWVGPLASGLNCLYKLSDRTDIHINTLNDATNYSLGVSNDAIFVDLLAEQGFEKGSNLLSFSSKFGAVKPFAAGRVDLLLGSANSLELQLKHAGLSFDDITPVVVIDLSRVLGNFLAVNLNTPTEIVSRLQDALDEIRQEGQLDMLTHSFSVKRKNLRNSKVASYLWENCI